jgi:hypothetical protein
VPKRKRRTSQRKSPKGKSFGLDKLFAVFSCCPCPLADTGSTSPEAARATLAERLPFIHWNQPTPNEVAIGSAIVGVLLTTYLFELVGWFGSRRWAAVLCLLTSAIGMAISIYIGGISLALVMPALQAGYSLARLTGVIGPPMR